jgi:sulfur-carrier protein adenylyltransferase/sulfurtransferase
MLELIPRGRSDQQDLDAKDSDGRAHLRRQEIGSGVKLIGSSGSRYRLTQALRVNQGARELSVGTFPPNAIVIDDPPPYLPGLLEFFSVPRRLSEGVEFLRQVAGLGRTRSMRTLRQLVDSGVLTTASHDLGGRYSRHALYFDLVAGDGAESTARLRSRRVGLIGLGGIGSNVAMILAAAGVGTLVCADPDDVEIHNLTRQFLCGEADVGRSKVDAVTERLRALNSEVAVHGIRGSLESTQLVGDFFTTCDVVLFAADNRPEVNAWMNVAALEHGLAYSTAGYIDTFGVVGPLTVPGATSCFECRWASDRAAHPAELGPNRNRGYRAPSYGPLAILVAAIQANEIVRFLLGLETRTLSRRLLIDSQSYEMVEQQLPRLPECPACGGSWRPVV